MNINVPEVLALIKEAKKRSTQPVKKADYSMRAELVADNLIASNVFPPEARSSVVDSLKDHGKTLLLLDKVACSMVPDSLGTPLKRVEHRRSGSEPELIRDSDRAFVEAAFRR